MESCKIYVDVNATFTKDGRLLPKSLIWTGDSVTEKIVAALENIADEKIKEMLLIQVKALAGEM